MTDERPRKSWPVSTDDQNLAQQRLDAGYGDVFATVAITDSTLGTCDYRTSRADYRISKKERPVGRPFYSFAIWILFFAMLFKVGLSCIFGVLSGVSRLSPRILRMVRGFFVLTGFVVLSCFSMMASSMR